MGSLSKIKEVSIILLEKISILQIDTLHHAIYPFTETCTYRASASNASNMTGEDSCHYTKKDWLVNLFRNDRIDGWAACRELE